MSRILATLGVALLLGTAAVRAQTDQDKGTAAAVIGHYTIVSGEKGGKPLPPDHIRGASVEITKDTITVIENDKDKAYVATYEIDAGKKPWRITMTSVVPKKGEVARGLIERSGDILKLIYALPGGEVPTAFQTKDKQLLFVLKVKKK
jgi:uncharacterized protein (TIGR03067 family)